MAGDQTPRHEEHAHPGSWVVYSLTPKGLLKEEFTSGVKTHTDLIYYDEIWDTFRARRLHRRGTWLLAWVTLLSAIVPGLPSVSWVMLLPVWGTLTAGWVLLVLALRNVVVTLYDFDGQDLATLHGPSNSAFIEFLGELDVRVRHARYPLQGTLEGLDLGSCSWKGFRRRWSCRYLYDRVVFESEGPFGFEVREFYGLNTLNPPVRLAWKVPKIALAGFLCGVLFAGPLSYMATGGGGTPWIWPSGDSPSSRPRVRSGSCFSCASPCRCPQGREPSNRLRCPGGRPASGGASSRGSRASSASPTAPP